MLVGWGFENTSTGGLLTHKCFLNDFFDLSSFCVCQFV